MKRSQTVAMLALGVLFVSARQAGAQVTPSTVVMIDPASPRWGESITITVEPNAGANEAERINRGEQLFAVLAGNPFKYEVVPNSLEISKAFGVDSFPRHMVLDRAGKIVWMSGGDDDPIERLRAMIVRVLASESK
jgi:hypothetical protein